MKCTRNLSRSSIIFILCLFASSNCAYAEENDDSVYAQLSSIQVQMPGANTITAVMEQVDSLVGLTVEANEKVIVKEPGVYFIVANGRVGAKTLNLFGNLDLFLMKNGNVIPHSFAGTGVKNKVTTTALISQTVLNLKKGDYISVGITGSSPNLGLVPAINENRTAPSLIFTMYKIK